MSEVEQRNFKWHLGDQMPLSAVGCVAIMWATADPSGC